MTPSVHPRRPADRRPRTRSQRTLTGSTTPRDKGASGTQPGEADFAAPVHWQPLVSVVIPVLNEERHIEECLESVFAQTYRASLIEIIVADGGSSDATRSIVERLSETHANLRLIDNPAQNQAAGLNAAIAVAVGEVIARLDGHAAWRPWHVERCVELLETTGADNVGGRMDAVGETAVAHAVACATASPFGVGGARFHYADRMLETDTVFLGCFRRSALNRVGVFNETYPPHEDYELNHRIRTTGGSVVFSPDVPTTYWARTGWRSLARQYFRYGQAKMRVARDHPGVLRPHHFAAPALVAALPIGIAALSAPTGRRVVGLAAVLYAVSCAVMGLRVSGGAPVGVRARVPLIFPVLHLCWGAGFWTGLLRPRRSGSPRRAHA